MVRPKPTADSLSQHQQIALAYLLEASDLARNAGDAPAAYACQLHCLQRIGITESILRWLAGQGLVWHQVETTTRDQAARTFRRSANLRFSAASCFLLTSAGTELAEELAAKDAPRNDPSHEKVNGHRPHYDVGRRILLVNDTIVKQFKVRAENQEIILLSYEEERWPSHLPDPLPGKSNMDSKRRLNEAIKNLNSRQANPLIRFHGDGTGRGIVWERAT